MDASTPGQYEPNNRSDAGLECAESPERGGELTEAFSIEGEVDSISSDFSEDVDEHRLLSASFGATSAGEAGAVATALARLQSRGGNNPPVSAHRGPGASRGIDLQSDSWNDDDIDPFSYYPPLTRWDCIKVSIQ